MNTRFLETFATLAQFENFRATARDTGNDFAAHPLVGRRIEDRACRPIDGRPPADAFGRETAGTGEKCRQRRTRIARGSGPGKSWWAESCGRA
jgi:hypothetical protein